MDLLSSSLDCGAGTTGAVAGTGTCACPVAIIAAVAVAAAGTVAVAGTGALVDVGVDGDTVFDAVAGDSEVPSRLPSSSGCLPIPSCM